MPLREWTARHPGRGARCLDRVSRRGASPDEDPGIVRWEKSSRPRQGVALSSLPVECDTLPGSYLFPEVFFPGVIGTSCLDTRSKSRRSLRGFAPAGSAIRIAQRQGLSLPCRRQRERLPRAGVTVLHKLSNEYFRDIFTVGRDWLSKLLDANNMLLRETKKKRPPRTTRGVVNHGFEDHVNTIPKYIAPDNCRLLVSDITYVKTSEGFVYLSLTMDAYSRIITGFDLCKTLSTEGPLNALKQSIHFFTKHGYPLAGLIFHSDRGCQYISKEMTELEAKYGIITSVTQTGDPLHNAIAERLNGTLKNDFLYDAEQLDFEQAKSAVKASVMTYNTARPHRAIGMKTPMQMLLPDYPNPLLSKGKEAGEPPHPQRGGEGPLPPPTEKSCDHEGLAK